MNTLKDQERFDIDIPELDEIINKKYDELIDFYIEAYPDIAFAHDYARHLHKDQKYGDKPYMFHLRGVAAQALRVAIDVLDPNDPGASNDIRASIVAAFLHDAVEDEKVSLEELGDELFNNIKEDEAEKILWAVDMLSRDKAKESYRNYIVKLTRIGNVISKIVKLADLRFNKMQNLREIKNGKKNFKHMYEKYSFAEHLVRQSLYTP